LNRILSLLAIFYPKKWQVKKYLIKEEKST